MNWNVQCYEVKYRFMWNNCHNQDSKHLDCFVQLVFYVASLFLSNVRGWSFHACTLVHALTYTHTWTRKLIRKDINSINSNENWQISALPSIHPVLWIWVYCVNHAWCKTKGDIASVAVILTRHLYKVILTLIL